jgi:hypothetical protein
MGQEGCFDLLDLSLPLERSDEDGIGASDYIDYYDMSFATALFLSFDGHEVSSSPPARFT